MLLGVTMLRLRKKPFLLDETMLNYFYIRKARITGTTVHYFGKCKGRIY